MTGVKLLAVVVDSVGAAVETVVAALDQLFQAGEENIVAVVVTEGVGVVEDNSWFRGSSVVVMVVEDEVLGGLGGHVDVWSGVEKLLKRGGRQCGSNRSGLVKVEQRLHEVVLSVKGRLTREGKGELVSVAVERVEPKVECHCFEDGGSKDDREK